MTVILDTIGWTPRPVISRVQGTPLVTAADKSKIMNVDIHFIHITEQLSTREKFRGSLCYRELNVEPFCKMIAMLPLSQVTEVVIKRIYLFQYGNFSLHFIKPL